MNKQLKKIVKTYDKTCIHEFNNICKQSICIDYPLSNYIHNNVIIYDALKLQDVEEMKLKSEFNYALDKGPGVIAIKNMFSTNTIDRMTTIFNNIIKNESFVSNESDHFNVGKKNVRVWNALEKTALMSPDTFIDYYSNNMLRIVSESWCGEGYEMTSQVNIVKSTGYGQKVHSDYHLGFQPLENILKFPQNVHLMSKYLTLQGAIAHTNMTHKSGSTMLLPFSHQYELSYIASKQKEFQDYFEENYIQIPLDKGDGLFFNPGLFHAAGKNHTLDINRCANLLQISSPFGKTMESVDHIRIMKKIYRKLLDKKIPMNEKYNVCKSITDGYPFPTNLDTSVTVNGLLPLSQLDIIINSLDQNLSFEDFNTSLMTIL